MICYFDEAIIDLIPNERDKSELRKKITEQLDARKKKRLRNLMEEVFGREIYAEEIGNIFEIPKRYFSVATLVYFLERSCDEIGTTSVLFYKTSDGSLLYQGVINLSFFGKKLFIRRRELVVQEKGVGLEMQCRLEKFCRENNIWKIYNIAASEAVDEKAFFQKQYRQKGAYVWARYGYEFDCSNNNPLRMLEKFVEYCHNHKIKPNGSFYFLEGKPFDLTLLKGTDIDGNLVDLGKFFLLNSDVEWWGVKNLVLDSWGTRCFIDYLRGRGREDLFEKYF